jgi:hypothetical protein
MLVAIVSLANVVALGVSTNEREEKGVHCRFRVIQVGHSP